MRQPLNKREMSDAVCWGVIKAILICSIVMFFLGFVVGALETLFDIKWFGRVFP